MHATMNQPVTALRRTIRFAAALPSRLLPASSGVLTAATLAWLLVLAPPMPAPSSTPQAEPSPSQAEDTRTTPAANELATATTGTTREPSTETLLLRIETKPQGATIFLDGQKLGTTPFTVGRVKVGFHALRLEMDHYSPVAFDLDLNEDTVVDLTLDTLPPPPPPPTALRKNPSTAADAKEDPAAQQQPASPTTTAEAAATTTDTDTREPTRKEQQRQQREERTLLRTAERHLKADRLTRPKGENALEIYQSLLQSDSARAKAEAGIRRLNEKLLALGREDLEAWRLLTPKENNALDRFRTVLTLDGNNSQAKAGLEELVDRLLSLAQRYASSPEKAREYLHQAETVLPGRPRIHEVRTMIFGQEKAQHEKAQPDTTPN